MKAARVGHWHATYTGADRYMVEYVNTSGIREYVGTSAIVNGMLNLPADKLALHLNANLTRQLTGA